MIHIHLYIDVPSLTFDDMSLIADRYQKALIESKSVCAFVHCIDICKYNMYRSTDLKLCMITSIGLYFQFQPALALMLYWLHNV